MTKTRSFVKRYFGFSRAETNGFLVLLPLMALAILSNPVYRLFREVTGLPITIVPIHEAISEVPPATEPLDSSGEPPKVFRRFTFNPNTLGRDSMTMLGFPPYLADRVLKFRGSGGRFRTREDLKKIYGMEDELYQRIEPLIFIPEVRRQQQSISSHAEPALFDINGADSIQLKSIRGIGNVLSRRITKFRDRLGGFIDIRQLSEVYGLDSVTYQQLSKHSFVAGDFRPKTLDLNSADEVMLASHPYLGKSEARMIVMYRLEHGNFASPNDITNIHGLSTETISRILPYLSVE